MKPQFFGLETYFLFWCVAAALGIGAGMGSTRRAGLPAGTSFVSVIDEIVLGIIVIFIYLPLAVLFAANFVDPRRRADAAQLATHRYDFPHSPIATLWA